MVLVEPIWSWICPGVPGWWRRPVPS